MADKPLAPMETILAESVGMTRSQQSLFEYVIGFVPNKPGWWRVYILIDGKSQVCSDEFEDPKEAILSCYHKTEEKHGYPHNQS